MLSIQSTETKNINFLGRKRINQKPELFEAFLRERTSGTAILEIVYDAKSIYDNVKLDLKSDTSLVVDIFVLGKVIRHVLPKKNLRMSEFITVNDVPDGATPRLRLKIISSDGIDTGIIYASTSKLIAFKSTIPYGANAAGQTEKSILDLKQSDDLNGCTLKVSWSANADITVMVDRSFYQQYQARPSVLRLVLYPDMMRSIAINLLAHYEELGDLDESCTAFRWLKFVEENLGLALQGDDSIYDPNNSESLLDSVEMIVEKFMATPWNGGKTLLEEALNGS